ncbi:hypothetical protein [Pseudomonas agarici]|nr:hypothetical protein [Pseudomonas agarici]
MGNRITVLVASLLFLPGTFAGKLGSHTSTAPTGSVSTTGSAQLTVSS